MNEAAKLEGLFSYAFLLLFLFLTQAQENARCSFTTTTNDSEGLEIRVLDILNL